MENAKPLMHIHDLVSASWQEFKKHWNESLKISVWLFAGSLTNLVVGVAMPLLGSRIDAGNKPLLILFYAALALIEVVGIVITLWAGLRLSQWVLAKDRGEDAKPSQVKIGWRLLLSAIWIGILTGLAVLGGFVLFIIPGIWLSILFQFSQFTLLEDHKKGTQALAHSAALVKGRWWATFWRLVVPGLVFYVLFYVCAELIQAVIGLIAGLSFSTPAMDAAGNISPLVVGTSIFAQGFAVMIFASLFVFAQAKLFHALKHTR